MCQRDGDGVVSRTGSGAVMKLCNSFAVGMAYQTVIHSDAQQRNWTHSRSNFVLSAGALKEIGNILG
jgi:hypothetical protein